MIRKAENSDLQEIQRLNLELFNFERQWGTTYSLDWTYSVEGTSYFTERIAKDIVFVYLENEKVIAYISGKLWDNWYARNSPYLAEIENMFVSPNARGNGVGKLLILAFKKEATTQGAKLLRVSAIRQNLCGIGFYIHMGFTEHELVLEQSLE